MAKHKSRRKMGARRYADYSQETLNVAVDLVSSKALSSYEAEKQFGIPRRTIINRCSQSHEKPIGRPIELSFEDEKHIAETVNIAAEFGSPLSLLDLRIVVYNYLQKLGKTELFKGKMPGERWARNFLERNDFTQRATQNIKRSRASKTVEELIGYYENLESTIKDIPATNILNFDETNLSDDPGSQKAIFKRGTKHPERVLNSSKSSVSIMFSVTADGECLPPYVVYKAEHLWARWCESGPPEARYNRTKSGWFDMNSFDDWFKTIVLPWANSIEGVKVIIGDNLAAHLSVDTVKLCEENNIRFVFLPTNATHLTQPLDVAFFGPMKKRWREILLNYKLTHQDSTTINKAHFPQLLHELMNKINLTQSTNIRSGFAACGIVPFDPTRVIRKLPATSEEESKKFDSCLLEYLQRVRKSTIKLTTGSNKKLTVQAGKSISTQEAEKMTKRNTNTQENHDDTEKSGNRCDVSKIKKKKYKRKITNADTISKDKPTDNHQVLSQPKSLKEVCMKLINEHLFQEIKIINSGVTETVSMLRQVSGSSQNLSFIATDKHYLPDCIQIKKSKGSLRSVRNNSSKVIITSNVVIKEASSSFESPCGSEDTVTDAEHSLKTLTKSVLQTNILPKAKPKATKQKTTKVLKKKKITRKQVSRKRKKKHEVSDSSSCGWSSEVITADTDGSEYESMDVYRTECLEEEEKENFDLSPEIPYGLSDFSYDAESNSLIEGKWIIARFATKKTEKHFVGRILSVDNTIPTIKFVRKVKTSKDRKGTFTYPIVDDICPMMHLEDIVSVLPNPKISRRGQIIFNFDFSDFNVQ